MRSLPGRVATAVLLILSGAAPWPVIPFTSPVVEARLPNAPGGVHATGDAIAGIVVNERQEPVAHARVHAFRVRTTDSPADKGRSAPFSERADGDTTTDAEGRFQIPGLGAGDYLVVVEPVPLLAGNATPQAALYARTFYPSTTDVESATRVSVATGETGPLRIALVRVQGVRVAGSVVSRSGRATAGLEIRLFHQLGGFGSESPVAVVDRQGTFEIARVPPGRYRLTVAPRQAAASGELGEFATTLIDVNDGDIDGLMLTLATGSSISGRVVAEPKESVASAVGMRVSASPAPGQYSFPRPVLATVGSDWSFQMSGLSGLYQFTATSDRLPFVKATRIVVDGVERAIDTRVELTDGSHDIVVFVTPRETPRAAANKSIPAAVLVERFKSERNFSSQFAIAKEIVERTDASVLSSLADWLNHEDRHIRGNVAFVFGRLGDPRGLQVIADILTDRSDRPEGQGIATASGDGRYRVERQIESDRYYAAHLLGDLGDPRAVPILVPLLKDPAINYIVPWALGEIGHKSAVGPLLETLDDDNPSMRVLAIYALETLEAKEAVPRLLALLGDHRKSNFGAQVTVADAAKGAIAKLR